MSQRVWTCASCGWRGPAENTVAGKPYVGDPPPHCRRCQGVDLVVTSEDHPTVTRVCQVPDCRRDFPGRIGTKYCPECRGAAAIRTSWFGRPRRYHWTPALDQWLRDHYKSGVKGLPQRLADQRGWPKWAITHRAQQLGICRTKERNWTETELEFLDTWATRRSAHWIAAQLKRRSVTAVVLMTKRRGIALRQHPGRLSMRQLEQAIGIDHRTIATWVRSGLLKGERKETRRLATQGGDCWTFDEVDVLRFMLRNPTHVHLTHVEPVWFLGLVNRLVDDQALKRTA